MRNIIYTCMMGPYDELRDPVHVPANWELICFTNQPLKSEKWKILPPASPQGLNQHKAARWHKTHAADLFGLGNNVIWHDANMCINEDPTVFLLKNQPKGCYLSAMKHPDRSDIYEEREAVIRLKKDLPERLHQVDRYREEGLPEKSGLHETGILLIRTTPKVKQFMQAWWDEIERGSHRDQLSFDYIRWKMNMRVHGMDPEIKHTVFQIIRHPEKKIYVHKKMDVVYVLGRETAWEYNEIRYSIRSFKKYFRDLGNIVIVGQLPVWAKNVIHIPWPDDLTMTKDQIIIEKVIQACRDPRVSHQFLFCSDDKLLLAPLTADDIAATHQGEIREVEKPTNWHRELMDTGRKLIRAGVGNLDFNTPHAIQPIDKAEYLEIMGAWPWKKETMMGCSVYHNQSRIWKKKPADDHLRLRGAHSFIGILKAMEGKRSMNYNDGSCNEALKETLEVLFPDETEYELYGTRGTRWDEYQTWIVSGKEFWAGVNLIRRHTRNIRLVRFFEAKGADDRTQKVLERNLKIISRQWER